MAGRGCGGRGEEGRERRTDNLRAGAIKVHSVLGAAAAPKNMQEVHGAAAPRKQTANNKNN